MFNKTSDWEADSQKFLLGRRGGGSKYFFVIFSMKKSIIEKKKNTLKSFDAD